MRRRAAAILLVLVAMTLVASALGPASERAFPVRVEAPSTTMALLANRTIAGRGDLVLLVLWLNVSGNGQIAHAWVNVTLPPVNGSSVAAMGVSESLATYPGPCVARGGLRYDCYGLHANTNYLWTLPAAVAVNTTAVGRPQQVLAFSVASIGTALAYQNASAQILIVGAGLDLTLVVNPSSAAAVGDLVQFTVTATNRRIDDLLTNNSAANARLIGNSTAFNLSLTVTLSQGLRLSPGSQNSGGAPVTLTPGSTLAVVVVAIVADNATAGSSLGVRAVARYTDHNNTVILHAASPTIIVRSPGFVSTTTLIVAGAVGLAAVIASIVLLYFVGQRRLTMDEAFLIHMAGNLIMHESRLQSLKKDDDLVASMFVAIQEFVKDSFRTQALLDEVSFGGRRAAVVRGEHVILAVVFTRGDVDYLFPQMVAAVSAIEATYGKVLASWDGRVSRLVGLKGILSRLLRGGYRAAWRAQLR